MHHIDKKDSFNSTIRNGLFAILVLFLMGVHLVNAQVKLDPSWAQDPPNFNTLINFAKQESEMRTVLTRYSEDLSAFKRRYPVPYSPVRQARLNKFFTEWKDNLQTIPFDNLSEEGKIDYILLRHALEYELERLKLENRNWKEFAMLVPFSDDLRLLQEERFNRKYIENPMLTAGTLDRAADTIDELIADINEKTQKAGSLAAIPGVSKAVALRTADYIDQLSNIVADWNKFYDGYDPEYNFWVRTPYKRLQSSMSEYKDVILRKIVGMDPKNANSGPIFGDPVGAEGLKADLAHEMIPYSPQELIAIGKKEFEWTVQKFKEVSNAMGFGDDWHKALEHTKNQAPPPGKVVNALYDIADYSFDYIKNLDNITLPPLEFEIWRLRMRSVDEQLFAPFFLGGEYTSASYPMEQMDHKFKLMSMRGNTSHFNFPTVQHELIPGHYHQGFVRSRFNTARNRVAGTPFWHEGNAFYWETLLWDKGDFARSNEDKMGMLFWRLHRAGRIIFSLNFHLGNWTPQECVDYLVNEVRHERSNAEGEVRRSFANPYYATLPLYQLAYMTGALQHRALYQELVVEKGMPAKEFHDAILIGGSMPIEMVRARILGLKLTRDYKTQWRWEGDVLKKK